MKEFMPPEERLEGDIKDLTDPFYRPEMESVLGQDAENQEQTVPAVRDDGIREHSVSGRTLTLPADQTTDTQADLYGLATDEFDQGPVIEGVNTHLSNAPAERTDLKSRPEMIHASLKNRFSGTFFTNKLAINQVLSYHNSALRTMRSLEIRAMTLCDAWCVHGGRTDLLRDGSSSFLSIRRTIADEQKQRKKKACCRKQHTHIYGKKKLRNQFAVNLRSDGNSK